MIPKKQHATNGKANKPKLESATTPRQAGGFTYCLDGHEGTFDVIGILDPRGKIIARLYYWDEPDTDEAARVKRSARTICKHLNQWRFPVEPTVTELAGGVCLIRC